MNSKIPVTYDIYQVYLHDHSARFLESMLTTADRNVPDVDSMLDLVLKAKAFAEVFMEVFYEVRS